jgi:endo-1,4-beta-D-glucanase Y
MSLDSPSAPVDPARSRRLGRTAAYAVLAYILVVSTLVVATHEDTTALVVAPADRRSSALAAADRFLDRYLQPSGRIARLDQGGDTVSEGQAYGMLLAVALGDETRFGQIWDWTDEHLQRADGLFAWRWDDGAIVDYQAATDADLLIAAALALGSRRFADAGLRTEAERVSDGILAHETARYGTMRVLIAGTWAKRWRMVNASYLVTPAMSILYEVVPEWRWGTVAWTSRLLLSDMMDTSPHLPPDWAVVDESGVNPRAVPSPDGTSARYSYDAGRVIVQLAVDCREAGQRLARAAWPFLRNEIDSGSLVMPYTLDGRPIADERHAVAYVAAAAAALTSGERSRADDLLGTAAEVDAASPTYFGSAWVALGRVWLDTDLLGGCRPGSPSRE